MDSPQIDCTNIIDCQSLDTVVISRGISNANILLYIYVYVLIVWEGDMANSRGRGGVVPYPYPLMSNHVALIMIDNLRN